MKFYSVLAALFVACTVGAADVPVQAQINTTVIDSTPKSLSFCKITPNTRGLAWSRPMEVLNTNGEAEMMVLDKNYTNPSSNLLSQLFNKTPQVQKLYLSVWTADGAVMSPWLKSRGEDEWRVDSTSLNGVSPEQVAIKIGNDAYPVKYEISYSVRCAYGRESLYAPASYITMEFSDELKQAMLNKSTEQQVKIVLQYENGNKTQVVETAVGESTLKAWSQLQAK